MIKINNLSKSFKNKTVLQNVNFNFEKGKIYGILGKNGAGKSTFFRCIANLLSYKGKITSNSVHKLQTSIGYLPTAPYYINKITGKEYLQLYLIARNIKIPSADINFFNLPLEKYVENYSTGMLKKLAFNALLLQNNKIFLLDEPFSGVDLEGVYFMKEIILELRRKGKLIILSSHIFSTIREICDEKLLLENGKLYSLDSEIKFKKLENDMIEIQRDKVNIISKFIR